MSISKSYLIFALLAWAEARFGQEHPAAIQEIGAVTSGGQPGEAATIAGGAISDLLAAANPCTKLQTGDKIIASLGTGADAVKAAQDFVAAEQNFNPFTQRTPTLCSDPTLPTTAVLRGIVPLIDPAVGGAAVANKLSAQSLTAPFDATGLSVADVFAAHGFSNFTTKGLDGAAGAAPAAAAGAAGASAGAAAPASNSTAAASGSTVASGSTCGGAATTLVTQIVAATSAAGTAGSASPATASAAAAAGTAVADPGAGKNSSIAGADFGLCDPTIRFAGGLGGRPATEFTFQSNDPKIEAIQQEALNPNIITNRVCDELTNQCKSNQKAKDVCQAAKAKVSALGTKDQSAADAFNTALGF
ncbi:MAG: hypothetical protein MMC23_006786 [Stictis urceolatum]|nr:hypothetical protein [Stictis urceolata]